jgi:hypothetical protein
MKNEQKLVTVSLKACTLPYMLELPRNTEVGNILLKYDISKIYTVPKYRQKIK